MSELEKTLNALLDEALDEDVLEDNPAIEQAEENGFSDGKVEAKPVVDIAANIESGEEEVPEVEKVEDIAKETDETINSVAESFDRISALLDSLNEELDGTPEPKIEENELEKETADKSDVYPEDEDKTTEEIPDDIDVDTEDVYGPEDEEKSEDLKEAYIALFNILEEAGVLDVESSERVAAGLEDETLEKDTELTDPGVERSDIYPEDEDDTSDDIEDVERDNEDFYNSDTEASDEEVDSTVCEAIEILKGLSDVELLEFLDANGFDPSVENANLLESILCELNVERLHKKVEYRNAKIDTKKANQAARVALDGFKRDAASAKAAAKAQRRELKTAFKDQKRAFNANRKSGNLSKDDVNAYVSTYQKYKSDLAANKKNRNDAIQAAAKKRLLSKPGSSKHSVNLTTDGGNNDNYTRRDYNDGNKSKTLTAKDTRVGRKLLKKAGLEESLSDLELMQVLEYNNYEPSIENLEYLKEALETGEYEIIFEDEMIANDRTEEVLNSKDNTDPETSCADDELEVSDPEDEQYDIDDELEPEENPKGEVKPEDLHEEDDVKPEDLVSHEKEEKPEGGEADQNLEIAGKSEENHEDPMTDMPIENKESDSEVKPEDIHESVQYTSIKEACMLDEGYFYEDTFIRESAEMKQEKLVEQVALIMAREASDPLYEELLKSAAYTARLQEACGKKYKNKAIKEAKKIMGEPKETLSENFH